MGASKGNFPKREDRVAYSGTGKKEERTKDKKKNRETAKAAPRRSAKNYKSTAKRRKTAMMAVVAVCILLLLCIMIGFTRKNGVEVFVGKTSIGIVKDKSLTAQDLEKTIVAQIEAEVGTKIKLKEEIKTVALHIPKDRNKEVGTVDYIIPKVREAVTYQVSGAAIMVNGSQAVVLATKAQAEDILNKIKAEYIPKGAKMEASFVEDVEIVEGFVDSDKISTPEVALETLQNSTETQKTYTVKSNDSLYKIAQNAEMTVEKLLEINSGLTIQSSLKVGQIINIITKKPYVSVKTVETTVMTDIEPKTYEYRQDNTKNKGYQKVIQQGKAGQKESTVQITRINGFVEEEKEISKKITVEPVTEIIVQGTK
ncbi:MAG: LysM peptidoglycan-binding domain-containing protein [Epulopiscium sp.]|nr:LysM peptidoglycan-binding domain-containing protein [Candidatus Epulonipiscium sp.]